MFSIETLTVTDDWVRDTTQVKEENRGKRLSILSFSNNDSGLKVVMKSEFERQPAILKNLNMQKEKLTLAFSYTLACSWANFESQTYLETNWFAFLR